MKGAPAGLETAGKRLWRGITAVYELSPGELMLLERACRAADRAAKIDALIAKSQPLVKGSTGENVRPNPLYRQAEDADRTLDMLIRSLALPLISEEEGVRRSPQQRQAAQARWRAFQAAKEASRGAVENTG